MVVFLLRLWNGCLGKTPVSSRVSVELASEFVLSAPETCFFGVASFTDKRARYPYFCTSPLGRCWRFALWRFACCVFLFCLRSVKTTTKTIRKITCSVLWIARLCAAGTPLFLFDVCGSTSSGLNPGSGRNFYIRFVTSRK